MSKLRGACDCHPWPGTIPPGFADLRIPRSHRRCYHGSRRIPGIRCFIGLH